MSAAMQIAERVHSLAQEQNDSALMIGACRALSGTLYYSGDFETARQYAIRGVQLWRSGGVQSHAEFLDTPAVICLCYEALSGWHLGQTASCQTAMAEAISLGKALDDMNALALALYFGAYLAHYERNPTEVDRLASDLIELSTRQNSAFWLAGGEILRGWARTVSGDTAESISRIEDGIEDWRATGSTLVVPYYLGQRLKLCTSRIVPPKLWRQ
jgi:predicted ATPase